MRAGPATAARSWRASRGSRSASGRGRRRRRRGSSAARRSSSGRRATRRRCRARCSCRPSLPGRTRPLRGGAELVARARALLQEVALTVWLGGPLAQFAGWVELWAGDPERAERELRQGYEALSEIGEASWLSTVAAILAESVYAQGREAEAEELTARERGIGGRRRRLFPRASARRAREDPCAARRHEGVRPERSPRSCCSRGQHRLS